MLMSQNVIFLVRMYAPRLRGKGNVNNVKRGGGIIMVGG